MTEKKPQLQRKALRTRERARNKKPAFLRQESWRDAKFSESWRRPRGLDNKVRRKIKGWPAGPNTGYKGSNIARGLHPSGYREVIVYNPEDVTTVDSSAQAIRIAHTVGKRKRALIIAEAEKLQVKILNAPIDEEITEVEQEAEEASESSDEKKGKTGKAKVDKSKDKESKEKKNND
ncbi:MAG: 50S ribosomal protein L32e [Candidatus Bathyarchaeota archaeon]|nr:50S ribosomal protein L32e [Candidatus Termiticorpusculum sp.]MCL1970962.1 50S ribosomal protein L32e [Candidatus Termiticorpusculum sp.]